MQRASTRTFPRQACKNYVLILPTFLQKTLKEKNIEIDEVLQTIIGTDKEKKPPTENDKWILDIWYQFYLILRKTGLKGSGKQKNKDNSVYY